MQRIRFIGSLQENITICGIHLLSFCLSPLYRLRFLLRHPIVTRLIDLFQIQSQTVIEFRAEEQRHLSVVFKCKISGKRTGTV